MYLSEVDIWNRAISRVGGARLEISTDTKALTSTTATDPVLAVAAAHGFEAGDLVLMELLTGMTELNGRIFRVRGPGAGNFYLYGEDGTTYTVNGADGGASLIEGNDKTRDACYAAWHRIRDEVLQSYPWNSAVKHTLLGRWWNTPAVDGEKITGITGAADAVFTTGGAHGLVEGDEVYIERVKGMAEVNDLFLEIETTPAATTFTVGLDTSDYENYDSNGIVQKALTPLVPDNGYDHRYALPDDCLRVLNIVDSKEHWERVGGELFADEGDTVPIRYIRRVTDPAEFDPLLVSALVARLAVAISMELSKDRKDTEDLITFYKDLILPLAQSVDAQEGSPKDYAEDDWVEARD